MIEPIRDHWVIALAIVILAAAVIIRWRSR